MAGLGNVGTRAVGELHDLGFDVACVDPDPAAQGAALARRLGLPLVIGDAFREETPLRVIVAATRAGLSRFLSGNRPTTSLLYCNRYSL